MVSPSKARAAATVRPAAQPSAKAPTGAPRARKQAAGHPTAKEDRSAPAETLTRSAAQPAPAAAPADPLDRLAAGDPMQVIAHLLWQDRYRNPEFAVQIKPDDMLAYAKCTAYLEVAPKVLIRRPPGQPAYPGMPPSKRFPEGMPPRPAEAPRDYVLVSLVDQDGNAFKPIESSEDGAKLRDRENHLRELRARAPALAQAVAASAVNKTYSDSEIIDLCNVAIELARA